MGASSAKKKPLETQINLREKIKSFYILQKIFSLISEKKKLTMINYNRKYQVKFGINIEYYKEKIGKYRIGEKNGNGIEYILNTNIKIFEGKYSNGLKNGKGKEFDYDGKVIFEGEYLNGQKISGTGYDNKGNKILVLKKNGKGTEYYDNGKIQFEGEYINGRRYAGIGYDY